jgi:hypothetical protein
MPHCRSMKTSPLTASKKQRSHSSLARVKQVLTSDNALKDCLATWRSATPAHGTLVPANDADKPVASDNKEVRHDR